MCLNSEERAEQLEGWVVDMLQGDEADQDKYGEKEPHAKDGIHAMTVQLQLLQKQKEGESPLLLGPAASLCGRLFDVIDADHSGFLEESEGKIYLSMNDCDTTELDYCWNDILRTADTNGDGHIDRQEFLAYVLGKKKLTDDCDFVDQTYVASLSRQLAQLQNETVQPPIIAILGRSLPCFDHRVAGGCTNAFEG